MSENTKKCRAILATWKPLLRHNAALVNRIIAYTISIQLLRNLFIDFRNLLLLSYAAKHSILKNSRGCLSRSGKEEELMIWNTVEDSEPRPEGISEFYLHILAKIALWINFVRRFFFRSYQFMWKES